MRARVGRCRCLFASFFSVGTNDFYMFGIKYSISEVQVEVVLSRDLDTGVRTVFSSAFSSFDAQGHGESPL